MGFFDVLNRLFPPKAQETQRETGRNDDCWCGSGKKYKRCHLAQDQRKRAEGGR